jgi:hypothetical protein
VGIGEMASRRALDAKFEVRILDPQLRTPSYEGVLLFDHSGHMQILHHKSGGFSPLLCLFDEIFFLMDMIRHVDDHDAVLALKLAAQQVRCVRVQCSGHAIV